MLAWSPILIQKIEIHALGFVLRKLQLNRHREAEVAPHAHAHAQLILYLTGEGWQLIRGRAHAARAGDLFSIPAGVPHGFSVRGQSRPVSLVLDYDLAATRRLRTAHRRLPPATLDELHSLLARVPHKGRPGLADYPAILAVVARLLEPPTETPPPAAPLAARVRERLPAASSLATLARETGYHRDHLTRKLKQETGLGLRAHRNQLRLAAAQAALRATSSIAEAATRAGFEDPNYFSRWFRRQTGHAPSAWRQQG